MDKITNEEITDRIIRMGIEATKFGSRKDLWSEATRQFREERAAYEQKCKGTPEEIEAWCNQHTRFAFCRDSGRLELIKLVGGQYNGEFVGWHSEQRQIPEVTFPYP